MNYAFLAFQDASQKNGIEPEKIALFAVIEGARMLAETRGVLMPLRVFKLIRRRPRRQQRSAKPFENGRS